MTVISNCISSHSLTVNKLSYRLLNGLPFMTNVIFFLTFIQQLDFCSPKWNLPFFLDGDQALRS